MQQRITRLALAAALSTLLVGTGCTATISGSPVADPAPAPTEGPGSDPVLWVDRVCGSLLAFTGPALTQPHRVCSKRSMCGLMSASCRAARQLS